MTENIKRATKTTETGRGQRAGNFFKAVGHGTTLEAVAIFAQFGQGRREQAWPPENCIAQLDRGTDLARAQVAHQPLLHGHHQVGLVVRREVAQQEGAHDDKADVAQRHRRVGTEDRALEPEREGRLRAGQPPRDVGRGRGHGLRGAARPAGAQKIRYASCCIPRAARTWAGRDYG